MHQNLRFSVISADFVEHIKLEIGVPSSSMIQLFPSQLIQCGRFMVHQNLLFSMISFIQNIIFKLKLGRFFTFLNDPVISYSSDTVAGSWCANKISADFISKIFVTSNICLASKTFLPSRL